MSNVYLPELSVMQEVADAMAGLTPAEKRRVAAWLSEYVCSDCAQASAGEAADLEVATQDAGLESEPALDAWYEEASAEAAAEDQLYETESVEDEDGESPKTYDTFDALYAAAEPKKGAQKAAVAAWWLENWAGQETWTAFEVNKLLKSAGVKVSSISIVLTNAVKAKTPLVEEIGRGGDSARSRKAFRLTDAGKAYVEAQLA